MAELTKEEAAWVKKLQKLIDACPSERIGAYTTGGREVTLYDRSRDTEIYALLDGGEKSDFCQATDYLDAEFVWIRFPFAVHSTAG